jgi:hypothetical protein
MHLTELIPDMVRHVASFLTVEEYAVLVHARPWDEVIVPLARNYIETILSQYNKLGQGQIGTYEKLSEYDRYYDEYGENIIPDEGYCELVITDIEDNYYLEITRHDKPLRASEFKQYVYMLGAQKGYLYQYTATEPGMIMDPRDPEDLCFEYGRHINTTVYPREPTNHSEEYLIEKREKIKEVLRVLHAIAVDVYSMKNGTRYENGFMYQISMLVPDGTSYSLELRQISIIIGTTPTGNKC